VVYQQMQKENDEAYLDLIVERLRGWASCARAAEDGAWHHWG
jgi:hypothetical protein